MTTTSSYSRLYGTLDFDPKVGKWILSDIQPHVAIRLKQMFPRIAKSQSKRFVLDDTPDTAADLEWFFTRYPVQANGEVQARLDERAKSFFKQKSEGERVLLPGSAPTTRPGLREGQVLRDYQLKGLDLAEIVRSLIFVDDLGLGKTYEGLGVGLLDGALPMVVVVEPHNQNQWCEKAEEFINLRVHKIKGTKPYNLPPCDIYIFKYTQLAGWVDILTAGWVKAIVFDEIQQLRTGTGSEKGNAAEQVCRAIGSDNGYLIGLTGTPVYNYGIECFNIVSILRPSLLGSREEFLREWCGAGDDRGVVKDPDALGAYLRDTMMFLRRTKADVGQEAKQTAPHLEWLEPDLNEVKDSIKLAEKLAMKTLSTDFVQSGMAAREFDLKMRQLTGLSKAKSIAAYAKMFLAEGVPILLFGWHREVYRIWLDELAEYKPLMYTGSESDAQKAKNKSDFIAGKSNLLILSLRSAAGVDGLQHRASTLIFGEFDWSPKIHEQCIGRLDRDGQAESVFVFYGVTNFGSDPEMIDVHGLKASQGAGIVDPGVKPKQFQSDTGRIRKLAQTFLNSRCKTIDIDPDDYEQIHQEPRLVTEEQLALL